MEGLWGREFETGDYDVLVPLLQDYYRGVIQLEDIEESEDAALTTVSEDVVLAGEPLADIYDTTAPDLLENSVNYGPRLASTDVELVFSLLEEVENAYELDVPRSHILAASRRAFLFKSLIAAALNFYLACEAIDEADEITDLLRHDFYFSLLVLLVEVVLAKYPFDYWIAWRGTRYIHNQFLVRARSILGNRGIAVIMKVIHWSLIRRQVSVDFTANFYNAVTKFALEEGEQIYYKTRDVLNDVESGYSLARYEDYGGETRVDIEEDAAQFIANSLIQPLTEALEQSSGEQQEVLRSTIQDHYGGSSIEEILGSDIDAVQRETIQLLFSEEQN